MNSVIVAFTCAALLGPAFGRAQTLPAKQPKVETVNIADALRGSANPHYLHLLVVTHLYRQLGDTLGKQRAQRLPPGRWQLDFLGPAAPQWVKVRWHNNLSDTTTYYMPASALKGSWTEVEI